MSFDPAYIQKGIKILEGQGQGLSSSFSEDSVDHPMKTSEYRWICSLRS